MKLLWRKLCWAWICLMRLGLKRDWVTGLKIVDGPKRRCGRGDGAWWIPQSHLKSGMQVIYAGLGTEASFELSLMEKWGAKLWSIDPTPEAVVFGEGLALTHSDFRFFPWGLWDENGEHCFHAPVDPAHLSHSMAALQGERPAFHARCLTWSSLLKVLGVEGVALLKMDVEGAEYRVLRDLLGKEGLPGVICLEFDETHTPQDAGWRQRIRESVTGLLAAGYELQGVCGKGNYSFAIPEGR